MENKELEFLLHKLLDSHLALSKNLSELILYVKEGNIAKNSTNSANTEFLDNSLINIKEQPLTLNFEEKKSKGIDFSFKLSDLEFLIESEVLVNDFKSISNYKSNSLETYLGEIRNLIDYCSDLGIDTITPEIFYDYPRFTECRAPLNLFKKLDYFNFSMKTDDLPRKSTINSENVKNFIDKIEQDLNSFYTSDEILGYLDAYYNYAKSNGMETIDLQTLLLYADINYDSYGQVAAVLKYYRYLRGM